MKTKLLFIALLGTWAMNAQTTHMVNWFMGVPSSQSSITIEQGDTVTWTWTDNMPHTVSSTSGTASFDSGTLTGAGQTFSHTFNAIGATNYHCDIHPGMQGTITVQSVMGIGDNSMVSFKYFPNPTTNEVTLTAAENINNIEVYDVNGKLIMSSVSATPTVKIYMVNFTEGTYFVKVTMGNVIKTITVVKK